MYDLNNTVLLAKVAETESAAVDILANELDVDLVLLDPGTCATTFLYTRFGAIEMPSGIESNRAFSAGRGKAVVSRFEIDAEELFELASNYAVELIDDYRFGCTDLYCFAEEMSEAAFADDMDLWSEWNAGVEADEWAFEVSATMHAMVGELESGLLSEDDYEWLTPVEMLCVDELGFAGNDVDFALAMVRKRQEWDPIEPHTDLRIGNPAEEPFIPQSGHLTARDYGPYAALTFVTLA